MYYITDNINVSAIKMWNITDIQNNFHCITDFVDTL